MIHPDVDTCLHHERGRISGPLTACYDRRMRTVPFPSTPAQVRECLSQAARSPVAVERDGAAAIVIMSAEEYARLVDLDRVTAADPTGYPTNEPASQA